MAWCFLPKPQMRAVLVVVADILREQPLEMAFVHGDDMVQKVSSAAFHPPFRHTILPGTFKRSSNRTYLQSTNGYGNLQPVLRVPVEDEEPRSRSKRKRLPQLLDDPQARRMPGDVEMQDASTIVADDEKALEDAECDRWHGEEVHRGNSFAVVPQKRKPALGWLRVPRRSFHPTGDRSLRDIKTQHEKLAMDARCSPGWVLGNHPEDQLADFSRRLPSSNPRPHSGDQPPVQAETGPVPADHCFRGNDDKGALPTRPEPADGNPEEPVEHE